VLLLLPLGRDLGAFTIFKRNGQGRE